LELVSLADISGVNALADGQALEFDPRLTLLFGQNGSGKTGYARILKRLSSVRAPEEILPNANQTFTAGPPTPSAVISYRVGGNDLVLNWANQSGVAPFTSMCVFDATAVAVHLDAELGYVYTPVELALFAHVAAGIQEVQRRVAAEADSLRSGPEPLLPRFTEGTSVYTVIQKLGADSDTATIKDLVGVPSDASATVNRLTREIASLGSGNTDSDIKQAQRLARGLATLAQLLGRAAGFQRPAYEAAREAAATAERRRVETREAMFGAEDLPGPPDEQWQEFIRAADAYRQHLGQDSYPSDGDRCLYCRQALGFAAADLLRRYREFLDETVVAQVGATRAALDQTKLVLDPTQAQQVAELLREFGDAESAPDWVKAAAEALDHAQAVADATGREEPLGESPVAELATAAARLVLAAREDAEAAAQRLVQDQGHAATAREEKTEALAELADRIELGRAIPAVLDAIRRDRRVRDLERHVKTISNTTLKSLTARSKLASEDLVNRSFESLFAEECAFLRAPKVSLRFQGRHGQAQRTKRVADRNPSAVLSEGEQKVLALADFLAENRMRDTKAPLVFDDPVTSLDYRRLDEVAARILKLAETHQVVVLTHNIMFASALVAGRANKRSRVKMYEVRDGGDRKGILAPDVEPRMDTPVDLAKRINAQLREISSAAPASQDALIRQGYDLMRAWCEAFVEQELLQNVAQRFRANVMMTKLPKIDPTRLEAAVAVIVPLFSRACDRMTGHSHPAEAASRKATVAELKEDWALAQAARSAYLAPQGSQP
jgi:energy-coupling factor transporter ATP-binding protein EcfA2